MKIWQELKQNLTNLGWEVANIEFKRKNGKSSNNLWILGCAMALIGLYQIRIEKILEKIEEKVA